MGTSNPKDWGKKLRTHGKLTFICSRYLPECLLIEILCRLPSKSVFRFKCTSKQWLSLISDPSFIRYYCSQPWYLDSKSWTLLDLQVTNVETPGTEILYPGFRKLPQDLISGRKEYCDAPLSVSEVEFPFLGQHGRLNYLENQIVAACNGLLLCKQILCHLTYAYAFCSYYIFNPVTKHCVALPPPSFSFQSVEGLVACVEEGVATSYKVVCITPSEPPSLEGLPTAVYKFEVFSSDTGEWKSFKVHFTQPICLTSTSGALNGVLHWVDYDCNIILAYDPYKDRCRMIHLPDHVSFCGVTRGRLRCIQCTTEVERDTCYLELKVWTLEDYESGIWHMEKFKLEGESTGGWYPVAFHPSDCNLIYFKGRYRNLRSFNLRTNKINFIDFDTGSFYLPLVLPPWPTAIPPPFWKAPHYV